MDYYTFNEGKDHYNFTDRIEDLYIRRGDETGFTSFWIRPSS